jgi:hypothetical protein
MEDLVVINFRVLFAGCFWVCALPQQRPGEGRGQGELINVASALRHAGQTKSLKGAGADKHYT